MLVVVERLRVVSTWALAFISLHHVFACAQTSGAVVVVFVVVVVGMGVVVKLRR